LKTQNHNLSDYPWLLKKAQKYCAVQERCRLDVSRKLFQWGASAEITEAILIALETDDFISERRFAGLFAASKVNQNKWGKIKIVAELYKRNIPESIVKEALGEIDDGQYRKNFSSLSQTKLKQLKDDDAAVGKQKVMAYMASKGYELDLFDGW
jgi:regulatory protein